MALSYAQVIAAPAKKSPAPTPDPEVELVSAPVPKPLSANQENRLLRKMRKEVIRQRKEEKAKQQLEQLAVEEKKEEEKKEVKKVEKKTREEQKKMKKESKKAKKEEAMKPKKEKKTKKIKKEEVESDEDTQEPVKPKKVQQHEAEAVGTVLGVDSVTPVLPCSLSLLRGGAPSQTRANGRAVSCPPEEGSAKVVEKSGGKGRIDVDPLIATSGTAAWLNGLLVETILELYIPSNSKEFQVFSSANFQNANKSVVRDRLKKLLEKGIKVILFPICIRNHWTLLLVSKNDIRHYNPASTTVPPEIEEFAKLMSWKVEPMVGAPIQKDKHNCGVLVCRMGAAVVEGRELTQNVDPETLNKARSDFIIKLLIGGYTTFSGEAQKDLPISVEDDDDETQCLSPPHQPFQPEVFADPSEVQEIIRRLSVADVEETIEQVPDDEEGTSAAREPAKKKMKVICRYTLVGMRSTKQPPTVEAVKEGLRIVRFELLAGDELTPIEGRPSRIANETHSYFLSFETMDADLSGRLDEHITDQKPILFEGKYFLLVPVSEARFSYEKSVFLALLQFELPPTQQISIFSETAWNGEEHRLEWLLDQVKKCYEEAKKAYKVGNRDIRKHVSFCLDKGGLPKNHLA